MVGFAVADLIVQRITEHELFCSSGNLIGLDATIAQIVIAAAQGEIVHYILIISVGVGNNATVVVLAVQRLMSFGADHAARKAAVGVEGHGTAKKLAKGRIL